MVSGDTIDVYGLTATDFWKNCLNTETIWTLVVERLAACCTEEIFFSRWRHKCLDLFCFVLKPSSVADSILVLKMKVSCLLVEQLCILESMHVPTYSQTVCKARKVPEKDTEGWPVSRTLSRLLYLALFHRCLAQRGANIITVAHGLGMFVKLLREPSYVWYCTELLKPLIMHANTSTE